MENFFRLSTQTLWWPFSLLACNIRKEDIKFLNIPDQFTNESLELSAEVHFTEKDNQNQNSTKDQILWNNSYIRIENKPVYYHNWVVNGVLNIKQLQDTQGKFLDYDRFKESFKNVKINFFEYISIVSAIKIYLKFLLQREEQGYRNNYSPTNSHAT